MLTLAADNASTSISWVAYAISFIIWILVISWTAAIARRKGRSPFLWGVLAFFFSLIALIVVALMPSKRV
jgi:cytochrome bd-type quinol oxidase subunit 2